jgi:hypothetical protein
MKKMKKCTLIFLCLMPFLGVQSIWCQNSKIQFSGYLKNMQIGSWSEDADLLLNDGFLHNRLKLKWSPDSLLTFDAEVRNRLFYGETVKIFPGYADLLDRDNGYWDGSFIPVKNNNLILSTQIDRLYLNFQRRRWNFRAGRQRINWGIATTWNPNDLFNAYNFLDFDYEERPGADAVRIGFKTDTLSSLELAFSPGRKRNGHIGAFRYQTNLHGYDLQMLAGRYHDQWTLGLGWAGNLRQAGFKGEFSVFKAGSVDSSATVSMTAQIDHLFPGEWYVSGGFLYAGAAPNGDFRPEQLARSALEPNRLMPVKWSALVTVSKPITPIFNGTLTTLWSPNRNLLLLMPALTYNIRENWDLDLTGQFFFWELPERSFSDRYDAVFLRLRWSF